MEFSEQTDSFSQSDSISTVASSMKSLGESVSPEERLLLQLLQRGIAETTEEHLAFGKEMSQLLSKLNLEQRYLPGDIKEGLEKVASILKIEKLFDLDTTVLDVVAERRKIEKKKREREGKRMLLIYDDLYRKHSLFQKKLAHLQNAVNCLETSVENAQKEQEDCYTDRVLLSSKLTEYRQAVKKLETDLDEMEVEAIYPEKILHKYKQYLETKGQLLDLDRYLERYEDLPPNLLQAKALLECKQKEYESLEHAFLEKTSCL
ncbi:hypothetical protein KM043_003915 [Ampulex compressa]|nr:hypothetical protein KM043_003915 [Ampulex compressa]